MMELYLILSLIELAVIVAFGVCLFHDYNKNWNLIVRGVMSIFIVGINIVQLVIEIKLERNILLTIAMIVMWGVNLFIYYPHFKKRIFKQK